MKNRKQLQRAFTLIVSMLIVIGLLPLSVPAADDTPQRAFAAPQQSLENRPIEVKTVDHDPYSHGSCSRITQEYGPNSILLRCEWKKDYLDIVDAECEFKEWPLIYMNCPDNWYTGKPHEAEFYCMDMKGYPYTDIIWGFPYQYGDWDGVFTYVGVNGTVEYGPTTKAPIGEGTYYVYTKVTIPRAKTVFFDGTFILGKTFTIYPSEYDLEFSSNVPQNASTKDRLTGAMPRIHFKSMVDIQQLPPNQFHLPGYTFDCWNMWLNGKVARFENLAFVSGLGPDRGASVLYAQWKPKTYKITYQSGGADGDDITEIANFDEPGKLLPIEDTGWTYENHRFLGWKVENSELLYSDGEDYVNLCGAPKGYFDDISDVTLTAQWVENGQIIASITKDGEPQPGLENGFSLKSDSGVGYRIPTEYKDGMYIFDPSQSTQPGGFPAALPSGDYELCFEKEGYETASEYITYGDAYAVSTVFDYYTVSLKADPDRKEVLQVAMDSVEPEADGTYKTVVTDGRKLKIKTTVDPGYHFDGYSAIGVAPSWENGDAMKAEQTIEVQGQAEIVAHAKANAYKVHFSPNTKDPVLGTMEEQNMIYEEPQKLFANQYQRGGYVFAGWNTKADGSGKAFRNAELVKNLTAKNGGIVTLYAQWKQAPVKTALLTFALNGGTLDGRTGNLTVRTNVGDVIKMPKAPERKGYVFLYWKGSKLSPGAKYKVTGNHTFKAVWEKIGSRVLLSGMTAKKTSLTLKWNKIPGADGYDIFFAPCGHEKSSNVCKKVKTIKGNKTFKWTKSGLKKGTSYKAYVRAYVVNKGKKTYVRTSPQVHAFTGNGTAMYTNAKSVKVEKSPVTLKKGKKLKLKAKVNKVSKNKKLMPTNHAPVLRYVSSNSKVAKVSSGGTVTAKGKGTCFVYAFAHNGVFAAVKITVK